MRQRWATIEISTAKEANAIGGGLIVGDLPDIEVCRVDADGAAWVRSHGGGSTVKIEANRVHDLWYE